MMVHESKKMNRNEERSKGGVGWEGPYTGLEINDWWGWCFLSFM